MDEFLFFTKLSERLGNIENLLTKLNDKLDAKSPLSPKEDWLDLDGAMAIDPEKRKKPTWYKMLSLNEVPHYKSGKRVTFLRSELEIYFKKGKVDAVQ